MEKLKTKWTYAICAVFIALNSILIAYEFYWLALVPVFLLIVLLFIYSIDTVILLITFLTPLSVVLNEEGFNLGISLPTEPLLLGVTILFVLKLLFERRFDIKVIKHPVTIVILIYLSWMLVTSLTSTMPIVSLKFFLARLWFIIPLFFIGTQFFTNKKNIRRFIWAYTLSLSIVVIYTIIIHAGYGFDEVTAHWVMSPFFNDHTAYGALLAMFIPGVLAFSFDNYVKKQVRVFSLFVFILFVAAIILSYCRAAWISLAVAFGVFLILKLRINYKLVILGLTVLIITSLIYKFDILLSLEKNKQDSSQNYVQHIQSISNISSDASNLERINRWQSGFRMFEEKPLFGWGPGTYQFKYAPFQHSTEKTIISTNAGNKGNAHSEYLGPLAESGFPGMLIMLCLVVIVSVYAVRVYKRIEDKEYRFLILTIFIALITYFVHGALNNFLDTDKAAVPFWGFIAMIVATDIYQAKKSKLKSQKE